MIIKNVKVNDGKTLNQAMNTRGKTLSQSCTNKASKSTNNINGKKINGK